MLQERRLRRPWSVKITLTTTPTMHVRDGTSWQRRIKYIWFLFKFWRAYILFVGPLIPCFGLLVISPLGFKARLGNLIHTWQRHTCYMFLEIDLWCKTCKTSWLPCWQPADRFHVPTSRHWWAYEHGPISL